MTNAPEIRNCEAKDLENLKKFLDKNFGYTTPESYSIDFAPLFLPESLKRLHVLWSGQAIVATAALHPVTLINETRRVRVGVVGAVATDETQRGKGFGSEVMRSVEAQARTEGLSGLVLWSDQTAFYDRMGFKPAGEQLVYSLDNFQPAPGVERLFKQGTAAYGWGAEVPSLYIRHQRRTERSAADWAAIEKIRSCTRVQWLNEKGEAIAYLGIDRGKDLKDIIHEWGGDALALQALLAVVLQNRPKLFWMTNSGLVDPVRSGLDLIMSGSMCLFKSLSPVLSAGDLKDFWFWGLDSN